MAEDAIATMLADYTANSKAYPQASTTYEELISKVGEDRGSIAYILPITVYPSSLIIRISMTGAGDKLEYIKDFAAKRGATRAAFMIDDALEAIASKQVTRRCHFLPPIGFKGIDKLLVIVIFFHNSPRYDTCATCSGGKASYTISSFSRFPHAKAYL